MRKYKLKDISIYKTRLTQLGMMELQFKSSIIETKKTYCSYKIILIQLEIIKSQFKKFDDQNKIKNLMFTQTIIIPDLLVYLIIMLMGLMLVGCKLFSSF
jgi:hypothetical protein